MTFTLPFGKYKGWEPIEAPTDYLQWMIKTCKLSTGLKAAIRAELEARGVSLPTGPEVSAGAPPCKSCGNKIALVEWQTLADKRRMIRATCCRCGGFMGFLPQTDHNKDLADRDVGGWHRD
jgi:hypothetical protein